MLPIKEQIKERDKICVICGSTDQLTVDHIVPLAEGGKDDFTNLRTLCFRCNLRKGPVPPLWQRIVNLFNGNFYWFKNDIRAQLNSIKHQNENFKRDLSNNLNQQLTPKLQSVNDQIKNLEATNKILIEKYNSLLKDNQSLYQEVFKQSERILQLQKLLEIEWNEELKEYLKIKPVKNVHRNRRTRQNRKNKSI